MDHKLLQQHRSTKRPPFLHKLPSGNINMQIVSDLN